MSSTSGPVGSTVTLSRSRGASHFRNLGQRQKAAMMNRTLDRAEIKPPRNSLPPTEYTVANNTASLPAQSASSSARSARLEDYRSHAAGGFPPGWANRVSLSFVADRQDGLSKMVPSDRIRSVVENRFASSRGEANIWVMLSQLPHLRAQNPLPPGKITEKILSRSLTQC